MKSNEPAGMTAEELTKLLNESMTAYEEVIQELKAIKADLRRTAEFERSYDCYSGKYEGLQIAIELLTGKRPYKPPEYLNKTTGSDLQTYQRG